MIRFSRTFAFAAIASAALIARVSAQTASIQGTVFDRAGAVVAGAEIVVTNVGTGQVRTATSGGTGKLEVCARTSDCSQSLKSRSMVSKVSPGIACQNNSTRQSGALANLAPGRPSDPAVAGWPVMPPKARTPKTL